MKTRNIFSSEENEGQFRNSGYVCIPLLDSADIMAINNFFNKTNPGLEGKFYVSTHSKDFEYRKAVADFLNPILSKRLSVILNNYRPVFSNFMVKKPGIGSGLPFHQDWTFVDEQEFVALNIWCPLIDSNELNGTMQVLEKSHLMTLPIRARQTVNCFQDMNEDDWRADITTVNLKAGEALIFDTKLVHGSQDNLSNETRVAVSVIMIPSEAELLHYYQPSREKPILFKYSVTNNFFVENGSDHFVLPKGGSVIDFLSEKEIADCTYETLKMTYGK